jgi:creatinine amidohydrolase
VDEVRITHLLPHEIRARLQACPVAWLPIGTLEWHGRHLPLGVDGIQAEGLCLRGAREIGGVLFPTSYYGDHRGLIVETLAAPGAWGEVTFDHRVECCEELGISVAGVVNNALRDHERVEEEHIELLERAYWMARAYGFTRIVALAGHGPNEPPAQIAAERFHAKQSACQVICAQEFFVEDANTFGHAGVNETSLMAYFVPDRVGLDRLENERPDEWVGVEKRGDDPRKGTAEQGEATADQFIARCREALGEIPPAAPLPDPDEDRVTGDWAEQCRAGAIVDTVQGKWYGYEKPVGAPGTT